MWKTGLINLKKDVYAYVQPNGSWFVGNSGLIVGKNWNVVVDSLSTKNQIEPYLELIHKTSEKPIKFVINTHLHADHVWTNHLFKGALAIAHENNRKSVIKEKNDGTLDQFARLMPELDFSESMYTPQEITINQNMTIYQDEREIRIIHIPEAHTVSDLIIHLPDEKIVYAGDILFSAPCTPFAMVGSITGNINALNLIRQLKADIYVPGHGPISYGDEALLQAIDYLKFIQRESKKLYENGERDYLKAALAINLGKYSKWGDSERVIGNVARAYSELRGEPLATPLSNTAELFKIMIERGRKQKGTNELDG